VSVRGVHYPASALAHGLDRAVTWTQGCALLTVAFGKRLCEMFGIKAPGFVEELSSSKLHYGAMVYMFGAVIGTNVMNTGAFEVFYDGEIISSKLSTGVLPRLDLVFDAIRARM